MTTRYLILVSLLCATGLLACDDVEFQDGTTLPQSPVLQDRAARTRVSLAGLESLYGVRWAAGVPLEVESRPVDSTFDELFIGPLDDRLEVTGWDVSHDGGTVSLGAEIDNFELVVPLRIQRSVGTRICRVRVSADRMQASVPLGRRDVTNPDTTRPYALTAIDEPTVEFTQRTSELVGSCPPLEQSVALDEQLDADILAFIDDSAAQLVKTMADISPSEELGLIDSDVELTHLTSFENRRGSMSIFSEPASSSTRLSDDGYALDFDMAVDSFRASCAPPLQVNLPAAQTSEPIPPEVLNSAGAEMAYALSTRTLAALAQNGVRAGLACIGLEDAPISDTSEGAVSTDTLALERVGLNPVPVGSFAVPVISPGNIPTATGQPGTGVIELSWSDLTIDIYADVRGVPVRILQLTSSFNFTLQPAQSRGTALELRIGSIDVTDAQIESRWRSADAQTDDLQQWTRRLLLLLFEDRLQLPLPVEPNAPLRLISTQVRSSDLLLLMDIDTRQ